MIGIGSHNVGRIAERIVANELEFHGFRVSDLNKEGTAANADLVAIKGSRMLQIQVKGSSNRPKEWWVGLGYFNEQITKNRDQIIAGKDDIFNRAKDNFYKADYVILVAVRSPKEYSCVVLPIDIAQEAARLYLAAFPWPRGRTRLMLELSPRAKDRDPKVTNERAIFLDHLNERGWERLLQSN